jgi:hypothetical protein
MSIVVRYPPSNVSKQQYDALRSDFEAGGDWPAEGCQLHVCFGPENDVRVSEVWDSHEHFQAWGDTLMPKMEQAGLELSGEPEAFDVHIYETF